MESPKILASQSYTSGTIDEEENSSAAARDISVTFPRKYAISNTLRHACFERWKWQKSRRADTQ
jgi:hypothetical protein